MSEDAEPCVTPRAVALMEELLEDTMASPDCASFEPSPREMSVAEWGSFVRHAWDADSAAASCASDDCAHSSDGECCTGYDWSAVEGSLAALDIDGASTRALASSGSSKTG